MNEFQFRTTMDGLKEQLLEVQKAQLAYNVNRMYQDAQALNPIIAELKERLRKMQAQVDSY